MNTPEKPRVIAVVGPTASGKTDLALELARICDGEIVSCDSMQIYRGMNIGTAKPTEAEMRRIRHHMIDIAEPSESFSAADYSSLAKDAVLDIISRNKLPIFCGGTGLYLDSVLYANEYADTETDTNVRASLLREADELGAEALWQRLSEIDPESAEAIHPNNVKRVVRALEIYITSGITKTEWDKRSRLSPPPFDATIIALDRPREALYERIARRVDLMIEAGLENEVRTLVDSGRLPLNSTAAQAIGYKEFIDYFNGKATIDEVSALIKQASRRYAKRQITWFKRNKSINWIKTEENFEVIVNNAKMLLTCT